MKLARTYAVSDPGRRRRRNEDSYVVRPPLFAVADGMGGAQAGELASRIAVEAMGEESGSSGEERVATLIREANRRVFARSHEDAAASGMGTTMTAALVGDDGTVTIGHVGDSRAYLLRSGRLEQLTEDHSLVAELVRSGRLSAEEAESHPQRSVITRALGTDRDVDVDVFTVQAEPGDLFLLCSDGLTTMVDDEEILSVVSEGRGDLEATARDLVSRANRGGGEDNITVVFFELEEGESVRDDEDTLTEADGVPVVGADDGHVPQPTVQEELDATARRVLVILGVVALVAVVIAVLLLGLRA
ncbi:MAG TPA: Stp1/IreP family PP2C-type Ser/Thr phosphatase [Gaiellaceae bacterium]|nr:Stp1/IreP family PP2C-type Ser/Thr phosphatase [Gaiellaceae bacterium]